MSKFNGIKLKYLCSSLGQYGANIPSTEYQANGVRFLRTTDILDSGKLTNESKAVFVDADLVSDYILSEGDLLLSRSGTLGQSFLFEDCKSKYAFAGYLVRFKPRKNVFPKFLFYITKSSDFLEQIKADSIETTISNFNAEKYANIYVTIPSFSQQKAIAEMLDREVLRLDELIAEKEHLLELLAEKRRALITHAVTRGINSKAKLVNSGIEWIGKVPKHWEIERTRWLFLERDMRSEAGKGEMLTVSHITGITPRSEKNVNMFEAETTEGYKICFDGDLVINTLWAWMGAMGVAFTDGIVSPAYHVYTPNKKLLGKYVDYISRIPHLATEVTRYSKGVWSSRLRLYPEGFYEVYFPVPPIEEQRQIVDYIGAETNKIDRLQEVTKSTVELLKERRASLITAAVTGKIKIEEMK